MAPLLVIDLDLFREETLLYLLEAADIFSISSSSPFYRPPFSDCE